MGGAGLSVGNEEGDADVNGLVVEGGPIKGVVVLEDDDGSLVDGGGLGVRNREAIGHAGLAHVLAREEGLVHGVGILGDAKLLSLVRNEAKRILTGRDALVDEDVLCLNEIAHFNLLTVRSTRRGADQVDVSP